MASIDEIMNIANPVILELFEVGTNEPLPFRYRYLQPFWNYVKSRIRSERPAWQQHFCPGSLSGMRNLFLRQLDQWGNKTILSTLIGELEALGPGRKYQVAEGYTSSCYVEKWKKYGPEFPEAIRLILRWTEDFIRHAEEVIDRVSDSYEELISQIFHQDIGKVTSIEGDSDVHDGRCVHILSFENGSKIVYKPRSLAIDLLWNRFLNDLTDQAGLPRLTTYRCIDKKEYGFTEFVKSAPVGTEDGFGRYFFNAGFLLGAVYFLQGSDLHSENLLACGEHPVLIDIETVVRSGNISVLQDMAANVGPFEMDSVLRSNMLPFLSPYKFLSPGHDALTSEIYGSRNLPYSPGGEKRSGRQYAEEIVRGFSLCYDTILKSCRDVFGPDGVLRGISECEIRFLLRSTSEYQRYLDLMSVPGNMCGAGRVQTVLQNLKKLYCAGREPDVPAGYMSLYREEFRSLYNGYIPRLHIKINEPLPCRTPYATCKAYLTGKYAHMDAADKQRQCALIRKCLSERRADDGYRTIEEISIPKNAGIEPDGYAGRLDAIFISRIGYYCDAMARENACGYIVEREHYYFYYTKMEYVFSEGYLGLVPALAEWFSLTGSADARKLLEIIAERILAVFQVKAPSIFGEGLVDGVDGVCLIAWRAFEMTGMEVYNEICRLSLKAVLSKKLKKEFFYQPSLYYTQVSSIYTLGVLAGAGYPVRDKLNDMTAAQLTNIPSGPKGRKPGLMSGSDGILLALLTARPYVCDGLVEKIDDFCRNVMRDNPPENSDYSLSSGLTGHLVALSRQHAGMGMADIPCVANNTFAFGMAGMLFALDTLSETYENLDCRRRSDIFAGRLLYDIASNGFALNRPSPDPFPSFLYGEGGVLYSLAHHLAVGRRAAPGKTVNAE